MNVAVIEIIKKNYLYSGNETIYGLRNIAPSSISDIKW